MLLDGQREQLKRVERAMRKVGAQITVVLDIVHVLEYLWRAAYAFDKDGTPEAQSLGRTSTAQTAQTARWRQRWRSRQEPAFDDEKPRPRRDRSGPVEKAAAYLVKHARLLHYDRALADGLPIATGVIEGACRYLVQDRMVRTGAR